MGSSTDVFKTVVLESSTWAVVRTDPARPRFMEVIANFYDEKRAKDYTDLLNGQIEQPKKNRPVRKLPRLRGHLTSRMSPRPNSAHGKALF